MVINNRIKMLKKVLILLILLPCYILEAQEINDTLKPAYSTASRTVIGNAGEYKVSSNIIGRIISPTGSADVIKFLQMMPGVSSGAEGSSAIYVRGGNLGGNVISLDGVPIYGSSHLLGFTSIYNGDYISESVIRIGGFHSSESNITASHIALKTIKADSTRRSFLTADNFSLGATIITPVKGQKLSFVGGIRYYPVDLEYKLLRGILSDEVKKIDNASANVYDIFGKLTWRPRDEEQLHLSLFLSQDKYSYDYNSSSHQKLNWSNLILSASYSKKLSSNYLLNANLSFNRFRNAQGQKSIISGTENNLSIGSSIDELSLDAILSKSLKSSGLFDIGIKSRMAILNPGSSAQFSQSIYTGSPAVNNYFYSVTTTLHSQLHFKKEAKYELLLAGRINANITKQKNGRIPSWKTTYDPEISFMAQRYLGRFLGIETTVDYLTGYYHNLEGVPLGWSVDMIIPSGHIVSPEKTRQIYAGLFGGFTAFRFKVGAYRKKMNNLIYFEDATKLFGSAITGWEDKIKIGEGQSKGVEILIEKSSGRLTFTAAYTYSKTTRHFEDINKNKTFRAKFDRPHILNISINHLVSEGKERKWGIRTFFTYQSGHMETVPGGEYFGHLLNEDESSMETRPVYWYSSINNYRFPAYYRLDFGIWLNIDKKNKTHNFNIGVYNVLNRHNPFSVIYEPETYSWKTISLLPIMPTLGYKLSF